MVLGLEVAPFANCASAITTKPCVSYVRDASSNSTVLIFYIFFLL